MNRAYGHLIFIFTEFESSDNPYIKYEYNRYQDNYFRLGLLQIDEKTEITRGSSFYYNTTIRLNCTDGNTVNMVSKYLLPSPL